MASSMIVRTSVADDAVGCAEPGTKPSAVAAFSNLISMPRSVVHTPTPTPFGIARQVSSVSMLTGPHTLPTEILWMIFQFVFESCVGSGDSGGGDDLALWYDEDPLSLSLFPYSLACVCVRWFLILKTVPIYWTRLVITVDAIVTSNAARTTLEWAGDRPLKVIVTRHHGTSQTYDSERAGVGRAMQLLRPHISHIWSLSFDVEHCYSIPALWRESGCAPYLKVLTLLTHSDTCPPISSRPSSKWLLPVGNSHDYEGKLKIPLLEQVTLSGLFLRHALIAHPRLTTWFRHMTSLTIRGGATPTMSLYKFLSVMDVFPSIRELTVEDIHFDDNAPYPNLLVLRPAVLCFRRVTGRTALRGILTRARLGGSLRTHVTIVDCTVHGFKESDPESILQFSSTNLALASMGPSATIEDLVCRWDGRSLSLIDCPRVTRAFLERLHGDTAPMCLSHLRLVDCESFVAGDVISLVQSRETQAAFVTLMGVADEDAFTALAELHVLGRGPPISAKRARWLAEHVRAFSWDTVAKDGVRYVWDGFSGRLMTMSPVL